MLLVWCSLCVMAAKWWFASSSTPSTFSRRLSVLYFDQEFFLSPIYLCTELLSAWTHEFLFFPRVYNSWRYLVTELLWCSNCSRLRQWLSLQAGSHVLMTCAHHFFEHLLPGITKGSRLILYQPYSRPGARLFSQVSWLRLVETPRSKHSGCLLLLGCLGFLEFGVFKTLV